MKITNRTNDKEAIKEIGERCRRQRVDAGISQEDVSNRTGLSRTTIINFEKGNDFKFSTLLSYLNVLGLKDNVEILISDPYIRPNDIAKLGKSRQRARKRTSKTKIVWEEDK